MPDSEGPIRPAALAAIALCITVLGLGTFLVMAAAPRQDPFFTDAPARQLSDADLDRIPSLHEDVRANSGKIWRLGAHNGVAVIAEHPCSDICPDHTVRILRYDLPANTRCESVGGIESERIVPISITLKSTWICQPLVLAVAECAENLRLYGGDKAPVSDREARCRKAILAEAPKHRV
jgi:hypothetical protein